MEPRSKKPKQLVKTWTLYIRKMPRMQGNCISVWFEFIVKTVAQISTRSSTDLWQSLYVAAYEQIQPQLPKEYSARVKSDDPISEHMGWNQCLHCLQWFQPRWPWFLSTILSAQLLRKVSLLNCIVHLGRLLHTSNEIISEKFTRTQEQRGLFPCKERSEKLVLVSC